MAPLSANRCGGQRQHINLELLLLQLLFCLNLTILRRAVGSMIKYQKKPRQKPADRPKETDFRGKTHNEKKILHWRKEKTERRSSHIKKYIFWRHDFPARIKKKTKKVVSGKLEMEAATTPEQRARWLPTSSRRLLVLNLKCGQVGLIWSVSRFPPLPPSKPFWAFY